MRSLLAFVALLGVAAAYEDKTVVEYLRDNNFTVLTKLIGDAGLTSALSSSGPFTVLAPTDAAFSKVGLTVLNSLQNDVSQLKKVLEYHVISGFILVPQIKGTVNQTTLEGQDVTITAVPGQPLLFNNNSRLVGGGDIICNNGVIHPIDTILLPPILSSFTISQVLLQRDDQFKDLFLAFLIADLSHLLDSGDFTLFAPVDSAFDGFRQSFLNPDGVTASRNGEILKYHIVPGERMSGVLQNGQQLFTLHGTTVNITKAASGVKVNQANVIEADIGANNGVIHAIDAILIPPEYAANPNQG